MTAGAVALGMTTALVAPDTARMLDVGRSQDAIGLALHRQPGVASIRLLKPVDAPLMRLDATRERPPAVAERWSFSECGRSPTFRLVPGAGFHDGSRLTEADARTSFERLLDAALRGEGEVGPLTSPVYLSDPDWLSCEKPDPDSAREFLGKPGYPNGFSAGIMATTDQPPTASAVGQIVRPQPGEAGHDLEIEMLEMNVYIDHWRAADVDFAVAPNGARVDRDRMNNPDRTQDGILHGIANDLDDTLDTLMRAGRSEADVAARRETLAGFERHLAEMAPPVWPVRGSSDTARTVVGNGFAPNPAGSLFGVVDMDPDPMMPEPAGRRR